MNRQQEAFVVLLAAATILSLAAGYPLTNVLTGNEGGWFTMDNIGKYGSDLDGRATDGEVVVFTGHPSYVIAADDARLVFDMPRGHYYASTFNDTEIGDQFYRNLSQGLRSGRIDVAVAGPMTEAILKQNATAQRAFLTHYCRVPEAEAQVLYNKTHATLYRHQPECPEHRRPNVENMSQAQ